MEKPDKFLLKDLEIDVTKGPVVEFKDEAELEVYLRWWQEKLLLNDWLIVAKLEPNITDPITGDALLGRNSMVYENGSSVITILSHAYKEINGCVNTAKFVAEETLVHELLHLKYGWLDGPKTYEAKYLDVNEHKILAQMARSLIMAKYNLSLDFFLPDFT